MNKKFFPTLIQGINDSFEKYGDLPFLEISQEKISYGEMKTQCSILRNCILENSTQTEEFIGIFAYKSQAAYTGIYGTLLSGKAYVPLHPKFPSERLLKIIESANLRTLVLSEECLAAFSLIAGRLSDLNVICYLKNDSFELMKNKFSQHNFYKIEDFIESKELPEIEVLPDSYAYLLFTSGSTGVPKGVAVTHRNVCAYAYYSIEHYDVSAADKFSQMPDLTFDLSVHDLYVSILSGASLSVVPEKEMMAPGKFIREKEITFWTSVPSVVVFLERFKMLKPNAFPSIRTTMFCGEALPAKSAELWQIAAPNSLIENTYGPTEATVAITNYQWNSETSPAECRKGIVPLGKIFSTQKIRLVDVNNEDAENGEIVLGGSQVAPGYFDDEKQTGEKFITFADTPEILWYKTGDLAHFDENNILHYSGRVDEQVKIRGYRVELQEIDKVLRESAGTEMAFSAVKKNENGAAICAFIQGTDDAGLKKKILEECRRLLPEYMCPSEIKFVSEMPYNQNGKIDRKMLLSK